MRETEFQIGQKVDWIQDSDTPVDSLGDGPFSVIAIEIVPEENRPNTGHSQWVQLCKEETKGAQTRSLVHDSFENRWVLPPQLSHFGKIHPTTLSGFWLRPIATD